MDKLVEAEREVRSSMMNELGPGWPVSTRVAQSLCANHLLGQDAQQGWNGGFVCCACSWKAVSGGLWAGSQAFWQVLKKLLVKPQPAPATCSCYLVSLDSTFLCFAKMQSCLPDSQLSAVLHIPVLSKDFHVYKEVMDANRSCCGSASCSLRGRCVRRWRPGQTAPPLWHRPSKGSEMQRYTPLLLVTSFPILP